MSPIRDPVATCYGMFKALFEQGYPFSYDLIELADDYIGYRRLMQHWQTVLPGRVIDFAYEGLVTNAPVAESRGHRQQDRLRLIQFSSMTIWST
jgi:hypothetical protein